MKALVLHPSGIYYQTDREKPRLTSYCNVLVEVHYAGICRTDVGIAKRIIPAREDIVLGHEFYGKIVAFVDGEEEMDGWRVGDVVSANPMTFGHTEDVMCGKDCDGAFAEYIAVPSQALIQLPPPVHGPLGAYLEPVAAALAPLKYIAGRDKVCIYGDNRIAELTRQVAQAMGRSAITSNPIAMKEICIQGARYGDFHQACHLLAATALGEESALDTRSLFGPVFELSDYTAAFAEASRPRHKKVFFKICAE